MALYVILYLLTDHGSSIFLFDHPLSTLLISNSNEIYLYRRSKIREIYQNTIFEQNSCFTNINQRMFLGVIKQQFN